MWCDQVFYGLIGFCMLFYIYLPTFSKKNNLSCYYRPNLSTYSSTYSHISATQKYKLSSVNSKSCTRTYGSFDECGD